MIGSAVVVFDDFASICVEDLEYILVGLGFEDAAILFDMDPDFDDVTLFFPAATSLDMDILELPDNL